MNVFDKIKNLFGRGVVRIAARTVDGRPATIKVPYIESFDSIDTQALFTDLVAHAWVKFGQRLDRDSLRIVGRYAY